ncbi:MAG TPA: DUF1638 domain-containing protein [Methylomusa anaerophila]|uniref:DUF1638 domain-containing protein n=1 Tax=Methylomusa anaerophila TaxID=1930071 RepID=A0A348AG53_9FIRM|nr:DUF1638 domain-containing protein [Methylomusa anaerophila]BBB90051.1 hypothetical protein MAMMFC1_00699 [Methylomusa anaerophila]HML88222.1 DUF1638 domain-containing protein [Methylomusa anaerophila]
MPDKPKKMLCCAILKDEIEHILKDENVEIRYLDPALHVDLKKLLSAVTNAIQAYDDKENLTLIFGTGCHMEMEELAARNGCRCIEARNCIEMLLGEKMAEMDKEARTFYLTTGWLNNWRQIFEEGLHWDKVDARQNFGGYDRIVLLDTGLVPFDDEKILEFFDFAEVPIEIVPIDLENLRKLLTA